MNLSRATDTAPVGLLPGVAIGLDGLQPPDSPAR